MNEYNLTFKEVLDEIHNSNCEYVREDWERSKISIFSLNNQISFYNELFCHEPITYSITPEAIEKKYCRIKKEFVKDDIKPGMVVKTRCSQYRLIHKFNNYLYLCNIFDWNHYKDDSISLNDYTFNMFHCIDHNLDIVAVYDVSPEVLTKLFHCRFLDEVDNLFSSCTDGKIDAYKIKTYFSRYHHQLSFSTEVLPDIEAES